MKEILHKTLLVFTYFFLIQLLGSNCYGQDTTEHYDLWIFSGSQEAVIQESKKFAAAHPEIGYKMQFYAPNLILIVGLCGSKLEVEELKKTLIVEYPDSKIKNCQRAETH